MFYCTRVLGFWTHINDCSSENMNWFFCYSSVMILYCIYWNTLLFELKSWVRLAYPFGAAEFTLVISGFPIAQSLVFCVCFVDHCVWFLSLIVWPLCCLSFVELWHLITNLALQTNKQIVFYCDLFKYSIYLSWR